MAKGQGVRLLDVFVLGPFMVWASEQPRLDTLARDILMLGGLLTIAYNAENYLRIAAERERVS